MGSLLGDAFHPLTDSVAGRLAFRFSIRPGILPHRIPLNGPMQIRASLAH